MIKSVGLIQNSSYDEISKIINDALKLGMDNDNGYDFLLDFEQRFELKARNPISTGWDLIDNITKGGLGRGELAVAIGSTGGGKSFLGVHIGTQALKQGKNVVHYTLELSDKVIANRYDSCLTGVPLNNIIEQKDIVWDGIKDIAGKLIIKEYPTKSATTNTIKNHLEKLKRKDFRVDMIIVDYADLLKPISAQKEKRTELESIYEELRGIAQIFNCPMLTFSQTNRCFSANTTTYILKEDGSRIKKHLNEIKVGDMVETIEGYKKVIDTNKYYQKTYTISLKSGKKITVSSNHKFPTPNGYRSLDDGLKINDLLLTKKCIV